MNQNPDRPISGVALRHQVPYPFSLLLKQRRKRLASAGAAPKPEQDPRDLQFEPWKAGTGFAQLWFNGGLNTKRFIT
jgi:hypothetical protein